MAPLVYSIPEACKCANAGRTTVYKAINTGALTAHKRGSRTIIFSSDLQRWLNSLPEIEAKHSKRAAALEHAVMLDRWERVDPTRKDPNRQGRRDGA